MLHWPQRLVGTPFRTVPVENALHKHYEQIMLYPLIGPCCCVEYRT